MIVDIFNVILTYCFGLIPSTDWFFREEFKPVMVFTILFHIIMFVEIYVT